MIVYTSVPFPPAPSPGHLNLYLAGVIITGFLWMLNDSE
jgi:hypothetical protein